MFLYFLDSYTQKSDSHTKDLFDHYIPLSYKSQSIVFQESTKTFVRLAKLNFDKKYVSCIPIVMVEECLPNNA